MSVQHFTVISVFPEMFNLFTGYGVTARAIRQNLVQIHKVNPRDYVTNKHGSIDDKPFGGGPGMVIKAEPLLAAVAQAKHITPKPNLCIYLSPQGQTFTQQQAIQFADRSAKTLTHLILICGRYEGIDQRVITHQVDELWSCGDYVLTGGELPAMVIMDSMIRLIPHVLGNQDSVTNESFQNHLLDYPHYTRPQKILNHAVPNTLLSGNHKAIKQWRLKQSLGYTLRFRPEILARKKLSVEETQLLYAFMQESESENLDMRHPDMSKQPDINK